MSSGTVAIPQGAVWLPGQGMVGTDETAAARAVEQYDPDLVLGQRRDTGEWIIFMRKGPNGEPFPVLGLGHRLPSADEITKKMYSSDVRRHGEKLYQQIYARQQRALAETRAAASEASGIAAEAMEWAFRKQGAHPSPRVFVPSTYRKKAE